MPQPTGARRGLLSWLLARLSAGVMAVFVPLFLAYAAHQAPLDYPAWRGLFAPLPIKLASLLFVAALLLHAWIGLREIFLDYVRPLLLRLFLYLVAAAAYGACLAWAAHILWEVAP